LILDDEVISRAFSVREVLSRELHIEYARPMRMAIRRDNARYQESRDDRRLMAMHGDA
jgi:hypothetical protein